MRFTLSCARSNWTAPLWRKTKRNSAPVGASARSRGLQPTDKIELGPKAPIGATAIFLRELLSPLSGLCELFANEPWAEAHGYALAPLSWLNRRRLLAGNIGKSSDFAQTGAVQLRSLCRWSSRKCGYESPDVRKSTRDGSSVWRDC